MEIPWLDLKPHNRALKQEILGLWEEILDTAGFIGGEHVTGLEAEFAAACGTRHSVALGSGTDALRFMMIALGLKPGDEVITVPNTFIATSESITQAGGRIVFVDIDPKTYNLNPDLIEAAITPRTRGIVPVHLYGHPAEMDRIMEIAARHNLWVIEDSCQAHLADYKGRKCGSIGRGAAFSFYPGKNLGACGEAGAITTNDGDLAAQVRMIRDHGQAKKYYHDIEGYNGRCDAIQAAALRVKLRHLPAWTESRRAHARRYFERLGGVKGLTLPLPAAGCNPVYHLFVVLVENRDEVADKLKKLGVGTGLHYPLPLHEQKAYAWMNLPAERFPVTHHCASRLLTLPLFPELTPEQVDHVCDKVIEVLS